MAAGSNIVRDNLLNLENLKGVLGNGGYPNVADDKGLVPLHYCVMYDIPQVEEVITLLLSYGAGINEGDLVGQTPLHQAVGKRRIEMVEFLLKSGADVNAIDEWERTPLHISAGEGQMEITKTLLANGADAGAVNVSGATPSDIALEQGFRHVARFLDLLHEPSSRGAIR